MGVFLGRIPGEELDILRLLLAVGLTSTLYCLGMGLNDYRDRERDRSLHPERPLPRGEIKHSTACFSLVALLFMSLVIAGAIGLQSLFVTVLIVVAIGFYNLITKDHIFLGPFAMGSVRFLLVLLGASTTSWRTGTPWLAATAVGGYIALVTLLSMEEESVCPTTLGRRAVFIRMWLWTLLLGFLLVHGLSASALAGWLLVLLWVEVVALPPLSRAQASLTTLRLLLGLGALDVALLLTYDRFGPASLAGVLWLLTLR